MSSYELKRLLEAIGRDGIKLDEFHEAGQVRRRGKREGEEKGGRGRAKDFFFFCFVLFCFFPLGCPYSSPARDPC